MLQTRGTQRTVAFRASKFRRSHSTPQTQTHPRDQHASLTPEHISTAAEIHNAAGPVPGQTQEQGSSHPSVDLEAFRSRLRDWGIFATSSLRRRADQWSKDATTTFSRLGLHLNRMTGYEAIEILKGRVVEQEARIKATRRAAGEAKAAYDDAVLRRALSQRQVNDLLQRKSSWTDSDVGHFTSLVRSDHSFEQEEAHTKARVGETEDAVDREFSELMRVILARYHEEQVWSDKIRSASTYGSLAVLGVNVVVFVMAIIVVEPWKRKRLAQTFERKVDELGAETKAVMNAGATRLEERLKAHEKVLTELITQVSAEAQQEFFAAESVFEEASAEGTPVVSPSAPSWWSQVHFSYSHLGVIRGRELVLIAGSAAAGGAITLLTRSLFTN